MENTGKFLPIGSVVLLKGGEKKVMITGFCSSAIEDTSKVYDYTGCVYPEGYLDFEQICLFDHEQIDKVFFVGYQDDEEKEFKKILTEMLDDYESEPEEEGEHINKGLLIPNMNLDLTTEDNSQADYL